MKKEVKKLGVLSFAKFQASLFILFGLLAGILYSFGGLIIDVLVTMGLVSGVAAGTPGLSVGTVLAFGALLGMPLIFGVLGFVLGSLEAIIYNVFAKLFGGLKIHIEH